MSLEIENFTIPNCARGWEVRQNRFNFWLDFGSLRKLKRQKIKSFFCQTQVFWMFSGHLVHHIYFYIIDILHDYTHSVVKNIKMFKVCQANLTRIAFTCNSWNWSHNPTIKVWSESEQKQYLLKSSERK